VNPLSVYVSTGVPFTPVKPEKVIVMGSAEAAAEANVAPARMMAASVAFFMAITSLATQA
jgi:hypothetical protein